MWHDDKRSSGVGARDYPHQGDIWLSPREACRLRDRAEHGGETDRECAPANKREGPSRLRSIRSTLDVPLPVVWNSAGLEKGMSAETDQKLLERLDKLHTPATKAMFYCTASNNWPRLRELARKGVEAEECPWCSAGEKPTLERYKSLEDELTTAQARIAELAGWMKAANKFAWAHEMGCPRRETGSACDCGLDLFLSRPRPVIESFQSQLATAHAHIVRLQADKERLISCVDPLKTVRFGGYGCLTDDCPHWSDNTCTDKSTFCLLGRTIDAARQKEQG